MPKLTCLFENMRFHLISEIAKLFCNFDKKKVAKDGHTNHIFYLEKLEKRDAKNNTPRIFQHLGCFILLP